ncbi:nucleoside diphosphate kinase regulator [Sphingomonas rhizophila]|uniref:Nucleoside diphosphate kinase regulator n=1 Tax=Sphingomonas rhizophila TaxID=2071607 RepID=A0A7G9SBF9_9SPHN|nr:nucleoside diphosphate kinase regulator [Sphingomonas rhizophila]QNN65184.1 nucleoside diphosphate kinase regulator [Sphingomonas rhizophila]
MYEVLTGGGERPPLHLGERESDLVSNLAVRAEHRQPLVAAMLLAEIDRAEIHDDANLPGDVVTLGATVKFVDERTARLRTVTLVLPGDANISLGRISILTPIGAALYGLSAGQTIDWPDRTGEQRRIRILAVEQPVRT